MSKRPVIGLLGGGQLGRMLCEAAAPLDQTILVLDAAGSPAKQINAAAGHVTGSFKDPEKVRELASKVDVLTVEIEHVDTEVLEEVAEKGVRQADGSIRKVPVHPSWRTLRLVQDKYAQKEHFAASGIPIAPQMDLSDGEDLPTLLAKAGEKFGFPFMVKARKGSYDGRGNFKVSGPEDFPAAVEALGKLPLYAEKWVPFVKELAIMVARTEDEEGTLKQIYPFPVVETVHEDDVCKMTLMPPRGLEDPAAVCAKAQKVAEEVVKSLWGRGVFAVEMFLLQDGGIMVNEVAPRPHNSGHQWIEAVPQMSQFKVQLSTILDTIPADFKIQPRVDKAIMLNILGGATPEAHEKLASLTNNYVEGIDTYLHLYGKKSMPGRKIGHITFTSGAGVDLEKTIQPFVNEVNTMRADRIAAKQAQLRPTAGQPQSASQSSRSRDAPLVVVTMGSDSDLPVLGAGLDILEKFGVPYDCTITSAHRTPARMTELAKGAAARGVKVLISAAGGAAHLPGMLASETPLPVIGIPIKATHLDGVDSLHSIVQMPRGIPVATVGINNSTNAALLAVRILGSHFPEYQEKMAKYQDALKAESEGKATRLEDIGYKAYLEEKGKTQ